MFLCVPNKISITMIASGIVRCVICFFFFSIINLTWSWIMTFFHSQSLSPYNISHIFVFFWLSLNQLDYSYIICDLMDLLMGRDLFYKFMKIYWNKRLYMFFFSTKNLQQNNSSRLNDWPIYLPYRVLLDQHSNEKNVVKFKEFNIGYWSRY